MPDVPWNDPREHDDRDRDYGPRVYGEPDRDDHDPRDSVMHDLDLPRGQGIAYDGIRFNRPAATAPLFNYLAPDQSAEEILVPRCPATRALGSRR
jgi:hypothetical protein